jgi:hypothetical protein
LAEGTLRALRDMALDEAVELHESLHFWSARWERPVWSWWEAGPLGTLAACLFLPVCGGGLFLQLLFLLTVRLTRNVAACMQFGSRRRGITIKSLVRKFLRFRLSWPVAVPRLVSYSNTYYELAGNEEWLSGVFSGRVASGPR